MSDSDYTHSLNEPAVQEIVKNLPCDLTQAQVHDFAARNAIAVQELMDAETAKKEALAEHTAVIKAKKDEVIRLTEITNSKVEWRDIVCYESIDRKGGIVNMYRSDTNDKVSSRPMNFTERQMRMGLE